MIAPHTHTHTHTCMATPFYSTSVDSGFINILPGLEDGHNQNFPAPEEEDNHVATLSPGVLGLNGHNQAIPTLELAEGGVGMPSQHGSSHPNPAFVETVFPEEERDPLGAISSAEMVGFEQDKFRTMECKLAECELLVDKLTTQLQSKTLQNERDQKEFQDAREEYKTVIASKNAEIEKLKEAVEKYKLRLSNAEKFNNKERERLEADIKCLQWRLELQEEEMRSKEDEIVHIKNEFSAKEAENEREKHSLEMEIMEKRLCISNMRTQEESLRRQLAQANESTASARQTIAEERQLKAESEAALVKEKLDLITQRMNSECSLNGSASDSSQNT